MITSLNQGCDNFERLSQVVLSYTIALSDHLEYTFIVYFCLTPLKKLP